MRHPLRVNVWARASGLALALFAAGTFLVPGQAAAQATIVHVVPPQPIFYSDALGSTSIDINRDGVADFTLSGGMDIDLAPLDNNAIMSVPELPPDWGAFIYALPPGTPISSSLTPPLVWWGTNGNAPPAIVSAAGTGPGTIGSLGYFQGQTDAYAGIRLEVAGSLYYGWIHIQNAGANWGQISDWAYETTPDTPITAGQVNSLLAFTATLSGSNEVPPAATAFTGTGSFTLDGTTLTCNVFLRGAMIPNSVGVYGPADPCSTPGHLLTNLTPPWFVYQGQVALSDTQILELLAGGLCVNVPSAAFPGGELRGAILPLAPVQLAAVLIGQTKALRNPSTFHASTAFTLTGDNLAYSLAVDTNVVLSSAGVFVRTLGRPGSLCSPRLICALSTSLGVVVPAGGAPGQPGSPGQILYAGSATLTDRGVEELKRGECYVGLGAAAFAGGELRGQISALDSDHDGMPDYIEVYLAQICPCDGVWSSHAQYVNRVSRVAGRFAASGWITVRQYCHILWQAQRSSCGKLSQAPPLVINRMLRMGTNTLAIGWPAVVGAQYQLQSRSAIVGGNWSNVDGFISARLTNVVTLVPFSQTNAPQFFRVAQLP